MRFLIYSPKKEKAYANSYWKSHGISIVLSAVLFSQLRMSIMQAPAVIFSIAEFYLIGPRLIADSLAKDPKEVSGCKFSLVKTHPGPI